MRFLELFARPSAPAARFLEGRVGYAIGDVHGCVDLLGRMIDRIEAGAAADAREAGPPIVVFLGDYVDRGPDSAGVIDLLLSGRPANCERRYLRGNHELTLAAFMDNPVANRRWLLHGGAETMRSYGAQPPAPLGTSDQGWAAAAAALKACMPKAHLDFLAGLERYVVLGDYVFVHAGVDAERPLEQQSDEILYWTRERFIGARRRFSHKVVHGHTPCEQPYIDGRRIGIDTGAYATGTLTAARFEGESVAFIAASSAPSRRPVSTDAAPGAGAEIHQRGLGPMSAL